MSFSPRIDRPHGMVRDESESMGAMAGGTRGRSFMVGLKWVLAVFIGNMCGATAEVVPQPSMLPPGEWALAYQDEFNGDRLDESRWNYRTDTTKYSQQNPGNVRVENGNLVILLRAETSNKLPFSAGGIISKKTFKHGYYETRMKSWGSPNWHPAFWTSAWNGVNFGGFDKTMPRIEMDFMESDTANPDRIYVGVHRWFPEPHIKRGHKVLTVPGFATNEQVIGADFNTNTVDFYINGVLQHQVMVDDFPHNDQHVWLTVIANAKVDPASLPGAVTYEYFRFYTRK